MRELTHNEIKAVSGAAFVEGFVTDDCMVWGACVGLVGSYVLGDIAAIRYNNTTSISLTDKIRCTFWTAFEGLKYGVLLDAAWHATSAGIRYAGLC